jgi:hypothetical protein
MNCQTFEALIVDLVREAMPDEGALAEALAHAAGCARCAARHAEEAALTRAFRIASSDKCELPRASERVLLSAYQDLWKSPAFSASGAGAGRLRRRAYVGIAASVVLALAGLAWFRWSRLTEDPGGRPEISAQRQPAAPVRAEARDTTAGSEPAPGGRSSTRTAAEGLQAARPAGLQRGRPAEIATDFIPLTYAPELSVLESAQLVRVRLPRSAMTALGLPFNPELAGTPVTAQVLIGQDGVARAIRFVSDSKTEVVPARMPAKR